MKLIATLGATKPTFKHKYFIEDKIFEVNFSFEALKEFYQISDDKVIIVGTSKTKEVLGEYILNYQFQEVSSDDFESIFEIFIGLIEKGDIIDLTQSFRSLPIGAFLSYGFSKSLGTELKDIFYAQIRDNKNPVKESCEFDFISLKRYDDMVELLREINLFLESYQVLKKEAEDMKVIHNNLVSISDKLYSNNLDIQNEIDELLKEIKRVKEKYSFLTTHLEKLENEIQKLQLVLNFKESLRFINMSEILFEKNMLLQSLTMLFEGSLAYLDEKTKASFICQKGSEKYTKNSDKYKFRNCLKSKISRVRYGKHILPFIKQAIQINDLEEYAKHLVKVDELRNNSAHAFINSEKAELFKEDIEKELEYFKSVIK